MAYLTTAVHRLHYQTVGAEDQPPLLILHGFLGNCEDFAGVLPYLSQHFFCILPDLPGHGKTTVLSADQESYGFEETGRSLIALLNHLRIERTHLLGYSMGGRIALYVSVQYSHRMACTMLESASPGLRTESERRSRLEKDEAIARQLQTLPLKDFLTQWYSNPLFESLKQHPGAAAAMLARRQQNNPSALANALTGLSTGKQDSLWHALRGLKSPLMLIFGSKDHKYSTLCKEIAAEYARDRSDRALLQQFEGYGHNVHLEIAQRYSVHYTNAIARFVYGSC